VTTVEKFVERLTPAERGRLEAARMVVTGSEQNLFGAQR